MVKIKRVIWVLLGLISLSLGLAGIFIPFLPTTPFLLLSAGLFVKGSDRLYIWLINHKNFGGYIQNFREYKAIPKLTKIFVVGTLWSSILLSVFFFTSSLPVRIILLMIGTGVTIHILHYKTLENSEKSEKIFRK